MDLKLTKVKHAHLRVLNVLLRVGGDNKMTHVHF